MKIDAPLRNVTVGPDTQVRDLPLEAIETMLDRGSLSDWRLLASEIERQPWGAVARYIETVCSWREHYGVDLLMERVIAGARSRIDSAARLACAARLRERRVAAGLTLRQLASAAGTSESRLSAYENGRVAPSTTVAGRIETVLDRWTIPAG